MNLDAQVSAPKVWYVNAYAVGTGSGTGWQDAFVDLQDGLDAVEPGEQIWVARGTYRPDRGTGDRTMSFRLKEGISLYGGFAGGETLRDQRDAKLNETVLSGDLNNDDGPHDCVERSDCCRVHDTVGCDVPSCAAMVCTLAPECCTPDPLLPEQGWHEGCVNIAIFGCCELGSWSRCDNSFYVLTATDLTAPVTLEGFTVRSAYANLDRDHVSYPAGLRSVRSSAHVADCRFHDNVTVGILNEEGRITVRSCDFSNNITGIESHGNDSVFEDSRFQNQSLDGLNTSRRIAVSNCLFSGAERGLGLRTRGDAAINGCVFLNNAGGGLEATDGRALVTECVFAGDTAKVRWGEAVIRNCGFFGSRGIGLASASAFFASLAIDNCAFSGTRTFPTRSTVMADLASLYISNSTFSANFAAYDSIPVASRAVQVTDAETPPAVIRNCAMWGHPALPPPPDWDPLIKLYSGATASVDYSIVQSWNGSLGGVGNSGVDPLFVDPDGADDIIGTEDDDLRLSANSPAINAGDPNAAAYLPSFDLDGHSRILCGNVDVGAYEFGIGDFDCNRAVNLSDFAWFPYCLTGPTGPQSGPYVAGCEAFDFNADSAIDLFDLAGFQRDFPAP